MMRLSTDEIRARAEALLAQLNSAAHIKAEVIPGESLIGGGSAPTSTLPTFLIAITANHLSADELAARLRRHGQPIVARVDEGRVLLDLRTVFGAAEEAEIARALLNLPA
jgi:L-seryl-tRNA(Ser) seleniumtransferase